MRSPLPSGLRVRRSCSNDDMTLGRAAVVGAASGLRASVGFATVLRRRWQPLAVAGIATELTIDKLPMTPSRLEPGGMAARLVSAAVAGAALERSVESVLA